MLQWMGNPRPEDLVPEGTRLGCAFLAWCVVLGGGAVVFFMMTGIL